MTIGDAVEMVDEAIEAVIVAAPRAAALAVCRRLKTRFQLPMLPVIVLLPRPTRLPQAPSAPDAWLAPRSAARDVVARVEELVRIRRTEQEIVRLNASLVDLAAENGRLYDRARRDADAKATLLRELQHRVRNNLASIQALLVLERHRSPARDLVQAIDVAIARLRSMAALQDCLSADATAVELAPLAHAVARSALEVFGASGVTRYEISGDARLPARQGSALAIVLNELITNALKHADARVLSIDLATGNGHLEVSVRDDGRGMSEGVGGGSGLTIVRAVVRNELGGEIRIEPMPVGTSVLVTLPIEAASETRRDAAANSSRALNPEQPAAAAAQRAAG